MNTHFRFLTGGLLAFLVGSVDAQTPCFAPQSLPPTSLTIAGLSANGPVYVSAGDLNGDNKADLVVSKGNSTLAILLGNGAGGFGAPTNVTTLHSSQFSALADLNGDSRLDIVSIDFSTHTANVLLGNGSGGFGAATSVTLNGSSASAALGDVTGDGRVDIVTANSDAQGISVSAGNGTGGFGAPVTTTFNVPAPLIGLGKIDNNTSMDVVISSSSSNYVLRGLNNGTGTFTFTGGAYTVGDGPVNPVLADVNGDNFNDLLSANTNSANLTVRLNNGSGGFNTGTNYEVNNNPYFLTVVDINGDTYPDAVMAMRDAGNVTVKLGNSIGGFSESQIYATTQGGSAPPMVATPDLTGDGKFDLVTPNGNGVNLGVLLNNGYGSFLSYNTVNSVNGIAVGDLNGDRRPDIAITSLYNVRLLLANANNTYAPAIELPLSANLSDIGIMDVNGDGNNDLLVVKNNGTTTNGELLTMLGAGNGTFANPTSVAVGRDPARLFIADVNRDTRLDVLVLNSSNASTSVFLGTGSGLGTPATQGSGSGTVDMLVTDLNRDGAVELVTLSQSNGAIYEYYGNGDGTFGGSVTRTVGASPGRIAAGDLNNDGRTDMVVTLPNSGEIRILQNNGNVGNSPSGAAIMVGTNQFVGGTPYGVEIVDLNGDGRLDIAVTQAANNAVKILYNTGTMSFTNTLTVSTGVNPTVLKASQLAGDARPDLVVGNAIDRTLSIINNCTTFPSVTILPTAPQTYTAGQPVSFTAVASLFTPTNYSWSSRPDWPYTFASNSTDPTKSETAPGVMQPTTYTITVTASNSLVSATGTKIITVVPTFLQTVKNGTWTDPTVWSGGYVPQGYEVVRIGHVIDVPVKPGQGPNYTLKVIYTAGGNLRFMNGARLYFGPD
ncbi:hypothetical protein GCM10027592_50790 [Spirosoma flavus]